MPFKSRVPIRGEIIEVISKSKLLAATSIVLAVDETEDQIATIAVEPRRSCGRIHFLGPQIHKLSILGAEIDSKKLRINTAGILPRPDSIATVVELDKKYLRRGQTISSPRRIREQRWELIRPLVEDRATRWRLFDRAARAELINARAAELSNDRQSLSRSRKQIVECLNQYLAGGGTPGALTPFSAAKGGKNVRRKQKKKLGRRNAPTKNGELGREGFIMSEEDKDICGFCWRNYYLRGTTIQKALRRMWRVFFSMVETDNSGQTKRSLVTAHKRPTRMQFERWGQERSVGGESWTKQMTKFNLARVGRVLFGSATDDVVAIGQRGAADSTSPDVEFVSVANRLKRIGSAYRILIVDSLFGYIPGFYLGLDAASSKTVRLAFLHALADKTEWLRWLGLGDQNPDNWIPMRFSTVLADNTDLRTEEIKKSLEAIDTGIKYVPVARSDMNSTVEAGHHTLHRMSDHSQHGTTHGQRHERGEERADILARHTVVEGIRETARAIYTHNTIEIDIDPTLEMRRELLDRGIKLTRANLTRWRINQGKVASSLIGVDEARQKLLPTIRGTFTMYGVKLLRPDLERKREFISWIRYISKDSLVVRRCMQAKVARNGHPPTYFDDDFLYDPYNPMEIYYKDIASGRLIALTLKSEDQDLPYECSLPDVINLMVGDEVHHFNVRNAREEALSDMEAGQEATKEEAQDAYDREAKKLPKPLSKASIRRDKRENRKHEKGLYRDGMPTQIEPGTAPVAIRAVHPPEACNDAEADVAVDKVPTPGQLMDVVADEMSIDARVAKARVSKHTSILLTAILNRRK